MQPQAAKPEAGQGGNMRYTLGQRVDTFLVACKNRLLVRILLGFLACGALSAVCASSWRVALSTGFRFDPSGASWITDFGAPGIMLTGDFNGDGKTDIAGWNEPAKAWHVALSTGHGFDSSAGFWIRNFGAPGTVFTGDF